MMLVMVEFTVMERPCAAHVKELAGQLDLERIHFLGRVPHRY